MPGRANILGCEIDRLDMAQTVERCRELIESGGVSQHMAINAAKLVAMADDPQLREVVRRCTLVNADGQSVIWASLILGDPLPGRVAGIDLMEELLALATLRGYRVYILGARQNVLERAVGRIRERYPGLDLAGFRDGYFSSEEDARVAREIAACKPDVLFVAMSSPRKEYFLGSYGPQIRAPLLMGVGGSIDVMAGVTRRAPKRMQAAGLEWLFRMIQEPRRMFPRYARTNGRFVWLVARAWLAGRRSRAVDAATG
jgi:N-acetylglucosaminyldiphosphoundecaprenol N-acetyl-beta-D-mannosaminyltransferase